jgi:hypothetical protein
MAKFYGKVGYAVSYETTPGVWTDKIRELVYRGDVNRVKSRWESSGDRNDDLTINNEFSIIADAYAYQNFARIKYIEWMNEKWKVTSVEVQRPRLIIQIGGIYNGDTP